MTNTSIRCPLAFLLLCGAWLATGGSALAVQPAACVVVLEGLYLPDSLLFDSGVAHSSTSERVGLAARVANHCLTEGTFKTDANGRPLVVDLLAEDGKTSTADPCHAYRVSRIAGDDPNVGVMPISIEIDDIDRHIAHIEKAARIARAQGARVINMSYGIASCEPALREGYLRLFSNNPDMLFVIGAGNDGVNLDTLGQQECYVPQRLKAPNAIVVGSVSPKESLSRINKIIARRPNPLGNDHLSLFSNYGKSSVHIVARGEYRDYEDFAGTSFSSPLVAKTSALMFRENPDLQPNNVIALLMRTADRQGVYRSLIGSGELNADAAVAAARAF